jgi:diacylglycerol kinase family enzyme
MSETIQRVAVVLNCKAGALLHCGDADETLRETFARAGLEPSFIPEAAGSLPERIAKAADMRLDAVVVAGGDGTIACAASALRSSDVPLAILACGTMNLLAKDLALPINDFDAAIALIASGRVRTVDVGEVNGHVFLCASMLGLPARLGRTRESSRGSVWRTLVRMSRATWRQMLRARRLRVDLVADARAIAARAAALTITVNPVDESSGHSFGRAQLNGGQFGLYIVDTFGLDVLPALVLRVLYGRRSATVREYLATEIDIAARKRAIRVMNDGEIALLHPPLRYRIRRGALRVLVAPP